jgi:hypothetical protein
VDWDTVGEGAGASGGGGVVVVEAKIEEVEEGRDEVGLVVNEAIVGSGEEGESKTSLFVVLCGKYYIALVVCEIVPRIKQLRSGNTSHNRDRGGSSSHLVSGGTDEGG